MASRIQQAATILILSTLRRFYFGKCGLVTLARVYYSENQFLEFQSPQSSWMQKKVVELVMAYISVTMAIGNTLNFFNGVAVTQNISNKYRYGNTI